MPERRIAHVDLDAFFISVEQSLNPQLRGRPAVVSGNPEGRGVVACASYEARAYGLRAGMPVGLARRLCPQAIFIPGDMAKYRRFSARFFELLAELSLVVEPVSLDEAYLDLTGCESAARKTMLKFKARLREELGLTASVGIASCKVVAKVASELSKPDGLLEVNPGEEKEFLAPLPIGQLPGVGPRMERELKKLGLSTIGKLASSPPAFLKSRFGKVGERLYLYANGIDERRVEPPGEAKSIGRETTLSQDTLDARLLEGNLYRLAEEVGAELRSRGKQGRCITLKLRFADFDTITRSQTIKEGIETDQAIFEIAERLLKKALAQPRKKVRLIGIRVSNLTGAGKQLSLFDRSGERLSYLNRAVDRIRQKYGFSAIETGRTFPLHPQDLRHQAAEQIFKSSLKFEIR